MRHKSNASTPNRETQRASLLTRCAEGQKGKAELGMGVCVFVKESIVFHPKWDELVAGTLREAIKNEGYWRWVELDSNSQRQSESSGVGPRSEMGQTALNLRNFCLYIRMKIGIFPFFLCPRWWECHSGDCPELLPAMLLHHHPCSPTPAASILGQKRMEKGLLSAPMLGSGDTSRVWGCCSQFYVGELPWLQTILTFFQGWNPESADTVLATAGSPCPRGGWSCWDLQTEAFGGLQWNRQLKTFSYVVRGERDCWGIGEGRVLSVSQDRLHNLSCSCEPLGAELCRGKGSAFGAEFHTNGKGSCLVVPCYLWFPQKQSKSHRLFFLVFLLKLIIWRDSGIASLRRREGSLQCWARQLLLPGAASWDWVGSTLGKTDLMLSACNSMEAHRSLNHRRAWRNFKTG